MLRLCRNRALLSIFRSITMSWRQYSSNTRVVEIRRAHIPLWQIVLVLAAQFVILGVTVDLAQAEEPPAGRTLSPCRVAPPAALGGIRKPSPESKKAYTFILAATSLRFTGAYDRAIEQIDQAIKLDPA